MTNTQVPQNETQRLAELYTYNILDTLSEKDYDDITMIASVICNTPVSLITLVDDKRQWFKSHKGLSIEETKRDYAFCAHALNKPDEMLVVPDSRQDKRFADNPLVTGEPHIIFYTGVPLVTPSGFPLGTLCVIDNKPRELSEEQLNALQVLSRQVMLLLEMRKTNMALQKAQSELEMRNIELEQFASVVTHDIKSPLTGIYLAYQLLKEEYGVVLGNNGMKYLDIAKSSAQKINDLVDGILSYYRDIDLKNREEINLTSLLESDIKIINSSKKYHISYPKNNPVIFMNKTQIEQVFYNLINNSLKYNDKAEVLIQIDFAEDDDYYFFTVKDNGIGIEEKDQLKIFNLFTKLNSAGNGGSYGIGLSTVKKIIERNEGYVKVSSEPGKGSTFSFSIKKQKIT